MATPRVALEALGKQMMKIEAELSTLTEEIKGLQASLADAADATGILVRCTVDGLEDGKRRGADSWVCGLVSHLRAVSFSFLLSIFLSCSKLYDVLTQKEQRLCLRSILHLRVLTAHRAKRRPGRSRHKWSSPARRGARSQQRFAVPMAQKRRSASGRSLRCLRQQLSRMLASPKSRSRRR